jgi:translation initiation factor 2 alpha subunit (eIF-2alpha)
MEEYQNVLCTVTKIDGTTVFVKLDSGEDGTIVVSEIAPGRIRNLRDYVVPGKKIVCKILSIEHNNIHLSLRRVSEKERKEVMEKFELEKSSLSILKSVIQDKADSVAKAIKDKEKLGVYDFLQNCKTSPEKLEKYFEKDQVARVCKILQERKEKQVEVKKEFSLSSDKGILTIKKILGNFKDKITYLAASRYLIKVTADDYKKANQEIQKIVQEIEINAKKESCKFETK